MDIVNEEYNKIVEVTCQELLDIMDVSVLKKVKDIVKGMMGRSVRTKDPMFWPAGMLMLGLVTAAECAQDTFEQDKSGESEVANEVSDYIKNKAMAAVSSHVDRWIRDYNGKIDFVDDALAGFCFVKAYELTGEEKYKDAADKIAQFILTAPRDDQGTIIYNPGRNSANIFADGIGQVSMFMAAYTTEFPDSDLNTSSGKRLDACRQIENFFKMGVDKKSGLNYHGYSLSDNQRKGLLGWGRAYGWLFMGVAEAACAVSSNGSDSYFNVTGLYRQMVSTALEYQRQDGGWSWQMQAFDGHIDMSATGMILYSIARGYRAGIIGREYDEAMEKAKKCIEEHVQNGLVHDVLSSCDDFGVHYQTYGHYPWGQGAILAALSFK